MYEIPLRTKQLYLLSPVHTVDINLLRQQREFIELFQITLSYLVQRIVLEKRISSITTNVFPHRYIQVYIVSNAYLALLLRAVSKFARSIRQSSSSTVFVGKRRRKAPDKSSSSYRPVPTRRETNSSPFFSMEVSRPSSAFSFALRTACWVSSSRRCLCDKDRTNGNFN